MIEKWELGVLETTVQIKNYAKGKTFKDLKEKVTLQLEL